VTPRNYPFNERAYLGGRPPGAVVNGVTTCRKQKVDILGGPSGRKERKGVSGASENVIVPRRKREECEEIITKTTEAWQRRKTQLNLPVTELGPKEGKRKRKKRTGPGGKNLPKKTKPQIGEDQRVMGVLKKEKKKERQNLDGKTAESSLGRKCAKLGECA